VPYLEARVGLGLDQLGTREGAEPAYAEIIANMKAKGRRPVDYFRMFFGDTAINGSKSGTRCGIDFFGCDHVLFGTDCPFDPLGGPLFIRDIIKVLDEIEGWAASCTGSRRSNPVFLRTSSSPWGTYAYWPVDTTGCPSST
jgi:hypothetical protein